MPTARTTGILLLITCCVNNASRYHRYVLRSFRDKETEAIWHRRRSRRLDGPVQRVAWRKLAMLDAAETLTDLLIPPGNRLDKLSGDRAGQSSIPITSNGGSAMALPPLHRGRSAITPAIKRS